MNVRTVTYSIDGVTQQIVIRGDEAWMDFLKQLVALARDIRCLCQSQRTNIC